MADPKPFASLSSGLLARKGAARPAMRPQGFGQVGNGLEDLGWNDMGHEAQKPTDGPRDVAYDGFGEDADDEPRIHHPTGLTPVQSPVHDQQAELADRLGIDPEDEDFDETAELYDPNAEDPDDVEETLEVAEDIEDSEPFKVANPLEMPEGLELDDSEPLQLGDPSFESKPFEPTDSSADPEPLELTERFDDFDPFQSADDETASLQEFVPPPAPAPVFEPASGYEPVYSPAPRAAAGTKSKAAFTLRLDPDRHLKLRLACAVNGRSAQQIVTDAVDRLLAAMPELDAMAEKAKRKG